MQEYKFDLFLDAHTLDEKPKLPSNSVARKVYVNKRILMEVQNQTENLLTAQ